MLMVDGGAKVMLKKHHSFITLLMGRDSHCLAFMLLPLIFFHHVLISDIVEEVLCLEDVFRDSPPPHPAVFQLCSCPSFQPTVQPPSLQLFFHLLGNSSPLTPLPFFQLIRLLLLNSVVLYSYQLS